ncbi:MAG: dihydrolipoyl dehydrogenase [Marinilabiliales bacterium]|nr:MAG: dihydrolipoyl dehydrogenase [Marinilabiliales bacterium]
MDKKQLIVLGAGPGGYAAAFQAANLGIDVTLIDPKPDPGGVCLFHGCIPTKALLHFARIREEAEHAGEWGLSFSGLKVDIDKVRAWKESVVKQLTGGLGQLAKSRKVSYMQGTAILTGRNSIEFTPVDGKKGGSGSKKQEIEFENLIIATGATPSEIQGLDFDGDRVMNAEAALELKDVPKKLLVVGAGYIGLEMSVIYKSLGSDITIAEFTPDILPGTDADLREVFKKERKDLMEKIMFNTKVASGSVKGKKVTVEFENADGKKSSGTFDRVLVSIGGRPNTSGIGLEEAGVEADDRGFVKVDLVRRTNVNGIYAIGDVTGQPMLAHKASHEGRVAAEHIAGHKTAYEPKAIPAVVFTDPEIAWTGLTETEAKEQGIEYEVAKFPWAASGRAVTLGVKNGLTKLLIDPKTDRLLGAAMVGKDAGSLVSEATLAIEMGAVARDLELTVHPHPTLSETIMEAAEVYYGHATHIHKRKK